MRAAALLVLATTLQAAASPEEEPVWRSSSGATGSWSAVAVYANDSIVVTSGGQTLAASAGAIALHADGRWFTSEDGTLTRVGSGRRVSGTHARLGAWQGWETTWACKKQPGGTATKMVTTVKAFATAKDTFVFEQRFPEGAQNTSLGPTGQHAHAPLDQALSQWPSFVAESLTWKAQGWSGTMSCGTTIAESAAGLDAQYLSLEGGPVLTFSEPDAFVENCSGAVFSTFDNFKSGIWANSGPGGSVDHSEGSGASSGAAAASAPQCIVHKGVDYVHHDIFGDANLSKYNTTTDLTGAECCGWCSGFSNCSAWTICNVCPAPYTNICFLKSSTAGKEARPGGQISGTRTGAPLPPPGPLAPGLFVAGVHGGITSLPVNHSTSFVLVAPERKCRVETMKRWGGVMRQAYGTNHEPYHAHGPATSLLGYWTDNGGEWSLFFHTFTGGLHLS
jgi:hypothetical protein